MADDRLARRLFDAAHLSGDFLLRSGARSAHSFDKYRFESDPALLRDVAAAMVARLPADTDALAGLELGGVPLATVMSQLSGVPTLFVRKEAKRYGTAQLAEGGAVAGRRLVVVEDVVTSGGQVVESARALRDLGGDVATALCAIDREAGGVEALAAEGLELRAAFRASELDAAARAGVTGEDEPGEGDVVIRAASSDAREAVQRLLRLLADDVAAADVGPATSVAIKDGEVVGMVTLSLLSTLTGTKAYLDHLVVDPAWRRQGIARRLVLDAERRARAAGASRIDLTAGESKHEARALYRSLGFERRDTASFRLRLGPPA